MSGPWTPREDAVIRKAVADGLSCSECAALLGWRSRHAVKNRACRLDLRFGKGPVPGLYKVQRARETDLKRQRRKPVERTRVGGDWDSKLFEPYAQFKARRAAERAP